MLSSYDIVIVGGGPAGLSAAIYGRRAERSVLVLEKNGFGGQIAWSPKVDNLSLIHICSCIFSSASFQRISSSA